MLRVVLKPLLVAMDFRGHRAPLLPLFAVNEIDQHFRLCLTVNWPTKLCATERRRSSASACCVKCFSSVRHWSRRWTRRTSSRAASSCISYLFVSRRHSLTRRCVVFSRCWFSGERRDTQKCHVEKNFKSSLETAP